MRYSKKADETGGGELYRSLEPVVTGLGFALIEVQLSRHRGTVQVRLVIDYGSGDEEGPRRSIGVEQCGQVHRAVTPRLELAFPERDLYLEVSSPGIDRLIKDGEEFRHYRGRALRCFRTDRMEWQSGILAASDDQGITLKSGGGEETIPYALIAKAKLDG